MENRQIKKLQLFLLKKLLTRHEFMTYLDNRYETS